MVDEFWKLVRKTIGEIMGLILPLHPRLFLLLDFEYFKVQQYKGLFGPICYRHCSVAINGKTPESYYPLIGERMDLQGEIYISDG